tara:strand:- start:1085 stop:1231 length:147 start_codon:yes stop_codon:yes gene_type:complete
MKYHHPTAHKSARGFWFVGLLLPHDAGRLIFVESLKEQPMNPVRLCGP